MFDVIIMRVRGSDTTFTLTESVHDLQEAVLFQHTNHVLQSIARLRNAVQDVFEVTVSVHEEGKCVSEEHFQLSVKQNFGRPAILGNREFDRGAAEDNIFTEEQLALLKLALPEESFATREIIKDYKRLGVYAQAVKLRELNSLKEQNAKNYAEKAELQRNVEYLCSEVKELEEKQRQLQESIDVGMQQERKLFTEIPEVLKERLNLTMSSGAVACNDEVEEA